MMMSVVLGECVFLGNRPAVITNFQEQKVEVTYLANPADTAIIPVDRLIKFANKYPWFEHAIKNKPNKPDEIYRELMYLKRITERLQSLPLAIVEKLQQHHVNFLPSLVVASENATGHSAPAASTQASTPEVQASLGIFAKVPIPMIPKKPSKRVEALTRDIQSVETHLKFLRFIRLKGKKFLALIQDTANVIDAFLVSQESHPSVESPGEEISRDISRSGDVLGMKNRLAIFKCVFDLKASEKFTTEETQSMEILNSKIRKLHAMTAERSLDPPLLAALSVLHKNMSNVSAL